jgi:hypothetical protein
MILKSFDLFSTVSECDRVKRLRELQEVNRNMPQTRLLGLRSILPGSFGDNLVITTSFRDNIDKVVKQQK